MSSSDIEVFVDDLANTIERDLIYIDDLSADTRLFWESMGYDSTIIGDGLVEPLPLTDALVRLREIGPANEYIGRIEHKLELPITGNVDRLIENYRENHYTHNCLKWHTPSFCWRGAIRAGNLEVVEEIWSREFTNYDTLSLQDISDGYILAVKSKQYTLLEYLIPYLENAKFPNWTKNFHLDIQREMLVEAVRNNDLEMTSYLLRRTFYARQYPDQILPELATIAVENSNLDIISTIRLINRQLIFKADDLDYVLLREAVMTGNSRVITYLLSVIGNGLDIILGGIDEFQPSQIRTFIDTLNESGSLQDVQIAGKILAAMMGYDLNLLDYVVSILPLSDIEYNNYVTHVIYKAVGRYNSYGYGSRFKNENVNTRALQLLLPFATSDTINTALESAIDEFDKPADANRINLLVESYPESVLAVAEELVQKDPEHKSLSALQKLETLAIHTGSKSKSDRDILAWAVNLGSVTLVSWLLKEYVRRDNTVFALDLAQAQGKTEIVVYLRSLGIGNNLLR